MIFFFFELHGDHRDLHVWTHSFPTRRSSVLDSTAASSTPMMRVVLPSRRKPPVEASLVDCRPCALSVSWSLLASASRSEEHTSELQSLMRNSYAVFCLQKKI